MATRRQSAAGRVDGTKAELRKALRQHEREAKAAPADSAERQWAEIGAGEIRAELDR